MNRLQKGGSGVTGQAIVEYVLIAVMGVAVMLVLVTVLVTVLGRATGLPEKIKTDTLSFNQDFRQYDQYLTACQTSEQFTFQECQHISMAKIWGVGILGIMAPLPQPTPTAELGSP